MALFKRGKSSSQDVEQPDVEDLDDAGLDDAGDPPAEAEPEEAPDRSRGPFDVSEVDERGDRVDLGAIWLPRIGGMELRMEVDRRTQRITGVACAVGGSGLQVQAFAAPRTAGIWDEIRAEISASVTGQGGAVDDIPGPFGRELLARLPITSAQGRKGMRPVRFVGVDGPRWFLRGVLTGKAAVSTEDAQQLETLFRNIVVIRDESPRPPRDLLSMNLPGQAQALQSNQVAGRGPDFDPLTRGPEITEIR